MITKLIARQLYYKEWVEHLYWNMASTNVERSAEDKGVLLWHCISAILRLQVLYMVAMKLGLAVARRVNNKRTFARRAGNHGYQLTIAIALPDVTLAHKKHADLRSRETQTQSSATQNAAQTAQTK